MYSISSLNTGGAEIQLLELLRSMDRVRFSPSLLLLSPGDLLDSIPGDVRCHYPDSSCRLARMKSAAFFTDILMSEIATDILVAVGRDITSFMARIAARRAGVHTVAQWLHHGGSGNSLGFKRWAHHALNRLLDRHTSRFIFVSESQIASRTYPGVPLERSVVIPNGIDTAKFVRNDAARSKQRALFRIPSTTPLITVVSSLTPAKRLDLTVSALSILQEKGIDFQCIIIGEGQMRGKIDQWIRNRGIEDRISLLGYRADVQALLQASDIHLLTSDNESFSLSVAEAMACSLPVVSTACGGPEYLIVNGETGFLVSRGRSDLVADRLESLITNPSARKRMGSEGRKRIDKYFSLPIMTDRHQQLLIRAISG